MAHRRKQLAGEKKLFSPSIVPRISAGRNDSYVSGAGTGTHAALARIEPIAMDPQEAKYAEAYVANSHAIELFSRVLDPKTPRDYAASRLGGAHVSPGDLWRAVRRMETAHSM